MKTLLFNFFLTLRTAYREIALFRNGLLLKNCEPHHKIPPSNSLLIVRLDAIGDYILFRNFLKVIRNSEKFNNYTITLCGNTLWKDIFYEYHILIQI